MVSGLTMVVVIATTIVLLPLTFFLTRLFVKKTMARQIDDEVEKNENLHENIRCLNAKLAEKEVQIRDLSKRCDTVEMLEITINDLKEIEGDISRTLKPYQNQFNSIERLLKEFKNSDEAEKEKDGHRSGSSTTDRNVNGHSLISHHDEDENFDDGIGMGIEEIKLIVQEYNEILKGDKKFPYFKKRYSGRISDFGLKVKHTSRRVITDPNEFTDEDPQTKSLILVHLQDNNYLVFPKYQEVNSRNKDRLEQSGFNAFYDVEWNDEYPVILEAAIVTIKSLGRDSKNISVAKGKLS